MNIKEGNSVKRLRNKAIYHFRCYTLLLVKIYISQVVLTKEIIIIIKKK